MDVFPRTYPIVRGRDALAVTVGDRDQLWDLRLELELVRRFGAWARPEIVTALEAEAARLRPRRRGLLGRFSKAARRDDKTAAARRARLEDMGAILYSAMQPVNAETIARIDREFPDISGELDMKRVKKESKKFRKELAAELPTESAPELKEIVEDLDEALGDEAAAATEQKPIVSADAESNEPAGVADDLDAPAAEVRPETDEAQDAEVLAALAAAEDAAEDLMETSLEASAAEGSLNAENVRAEMAPPEGDERVDSATDSVADELVRQREHLDAVASVFTEATREIDGLAESINEVAAADEPVSADQPRAGAAEEESSIPTAWISDNDTPPRRGSDGPANGPATDIGSMTHELRREIENLKAGVLTQLDRAAALIEQMDGTYQRLEAMTSRATQWQQALEDAHQAGQRFAETQTAAVAARGDFEQAQARADEAWRLWREANLKAGAATGCVVES